MTLMICSWKRITLQQRTRSALRIVENWLWLAGTGQLQRESDKLLSRAH